jgi:quinol monooxygenase YgiN
VLIRAEDDPRHFVSFGRWRDLASAVAWKQRPEFRELLGGCRSVCDEFSGGDFMAAAEMGSPTG